MGNPFILMCAPNGARRTKTDHPQLPISPQEIAECAEQIQQVGACILHLHVRDGEGRHTLDSDRYFAAIEAIREVVGDELVIQITTEAVGIYSREEQIACVKSVKPEAVSIALREICPSENEVKDTASFFDWMQQEAILPQIILYDQNDVERFFNLRDRGVWCADKPFVLCVLGRHGPEGEKPEHALTNFSTELDSQDIPWAVCGFAEIEHKIAASAAKLGGHVRVGFENNLWRQNGELAADNAELVLKAGRAASNCGRQLMSASDVRNRFNTRR